MRSSFNVKNPSETSSFLYPKSSIIMIILPMVFSLITTEGWGGRAIGISGSLDRDFKTRRIQTDKNNVKNTNRVLKKQIELGLNKIKTFLLITLPITVRQALPAYGKELILMVKASSLISIITLMEITGIARTIISKTYAPVEIFLVAGSIYLIINFIIVLAVGLAERKLGTVKAN